MEVCLCEQDGLVFCLDSYGCGVPGRNFMTEKVRDDLLPPAGYICTIAATYAIVRT